MDHSPPPLWHLSNNNLFARTRPRPPASSWWTEPHAQQDRAAFQVQPRRHRSAWREGR